MSKGSYTNKVLEECYKDYKNGKSITFIARERKLDRHHLSKKLKDKYGIDPSKKRNYHVENSTIYRKYNLNQSFFDNIDSEEKAYWLGFLYADGYINKNNQSLELGLAEIDRKHIEKFASSINSDYPIYGKVTKIKDKEFKSYRIDIHSVYMVTSLIKLGCVSNKSLIIEYPSFIKNSIFEKDFIRGIFDGDGSISVSKNGGSKIAFFSGHEKFLFDIKSRILHLTGIEMQLKKEKTCYALRSSKNKEMKIILDAMYKDASIYLDRKYEKYQNRFCRP